MTITVVLIDDHAIVRDGLKTLLHAQGDIEVVGEAGDGQAGVAEALRLRPQVVVTDLAMPNMNGIEVVRRVRVGSPATRVIVLSMHSTAEHVYRALEAGALGYLLKEAAGADLVAAIRAVHAGRRFFSDKVNELVISGYLGEKDSGSPLESLSKREREILQLVVDGGTNAAIAAQLSLSVKTVETYRARMMHKLGIDNLADLVKFAVEQKLTK